jgi:hypothetical protein
MLTEQQTGTNSQLITGVFNLSVIKEQAENPVKILKIGTNNC